MARQKRDVRKARATLVAQKRLAQRHDMIDWEEDVMYPLLEMVAEGRATVEFEPTRPRELEPGDAG